MTLLLAGDIGSQTTLLLVETQAEKVQARSDLSILYEAHYPIRSYSDLKGIVQKFMADAPQPSDIPLKPQKACFAVPGPVFKNTVELTNLSLGWSQLQAKSLEEEVDIAQISLINDFEAVCYGIHFINKSDLYCLQEGQCHKEQSQECSRMAVIGVGTGLGEASLIDRKNDIEVYASEGGHSDFAPRSEREFQLSQYLRRKYRRENNPPHISVERVVSGPGIVDIYQFLRDECQVSSQVPDIDREIKTWKVETEDKQSGFAASVTPAAEIAKAALFKTDPLCEQTMNMFLEAYGSEAGNFALKLLPYGGLYVAGGITPRILPLLENDENDEGIFLKAFKQKGRMSKLLEKIPVYVVLDFQAGLLGAAICAARL